MTELQDRKKEAHVCFDLIWKCGILSRTDAYKWLAKKMKLSIYQCHIKKMTLPQIFKVIKYSRHLLEENKINAPFSTKKMYKKYEPRKK